MKFLRRLCLERCTLNCSCVMKMSPKGEDRTLRTIRWPETRQIYILIVIINDQVVLDFIFFYFVLIMMLRLFYTLLVINNCMFVKFLHSHTQYHLCWLSKQEKQGWLAMPPYRRRCWSVMTIYDLLRYEFLLFFMFRKIAFISLLIHEKDWCIFYVVVCYCVTTALLMVVIGKPR